MLPVKFELDDNINMTWFRSILMSTVLIGALMSSSADAQPAARVFRIGTLGNENAPVWEGLREGLRDLGYVEGRNISIEARWSDGLRIDYPHLRASWLR